MPRNLQDKETDGVSTTVPGMALTGLCETIGACGIDKSLDNPNERQYE